MAITGLRAAITGGTGAIGAHLVAELLSSPAWSRVTVIGRRAWALPPSWGGPPVDVAAELASGRLVQRTVDMEAVAAQTETAAGLFTGADACFCTLGTTHAVAGSAAAFRRVDLDYVAATAALARRGDAAYFGHVTAVSMGWLDGLSNYGRTKAAAEAAIRALAFPHATVLRPGLLDRGDVTRGAERAMLAVTAWLPAAAAATPVGVVARAMRVDAEAALAGMPRVQRGGDVAPTPAPPVFAILQTADIARLGAGAR